MEKTILSEKDFEYIKNLIEIWKESYEYFIKLPFEEMRDKVIQLTLDYLKKNFNEVKYSILKYKDNSDKLEDTIAFNLGDSEKPELYVFLTPNGPFLFDESHYDAYDEGPFLKPSY